MQAWHTPWVSYWPPRPCWNLPHVTPEKGERSTWPGDTALEIILDGLDASRQMAPHGCGQRRRARGTAIRLRQHCDQRGYPLPEPVLPSGHGASRLGGRMRPDWLHCRIGSRWRNRGPHWPKEGPLPMRRVLSGFVSRNALRRLVHAIRVLETAGRVGYRWSIDHLPY